MAPVAVWQAPTESACTFALTLTLRPDLPKCAYTVCALPRGLTGSSAVTYLQSLQGAGLAPRPILKRHLLTSYILPTTVVVHPHSVVQLRGYRQHYHFTNALVETRYGAFTPTLAPWRHTIWRHVI